MEDGLRGPPSRGRGPDTLKPARERGIRSSELLENNDAQGSLQALGDSVISEPMLRHEFRLSRAVHGARTAMRTAIGMTLQRGTALRVALRWGVHPVLCKEIVDPYCVSK